MAQVTLNTVNEDGDPVTHTFHIEDEHADDEAPVLEQLASRAEKVAGLRSDVSDKEEALEATRDLVVGEIVRRRKLAGEIDEDSTEEERDFLQTLPPEKLKVHWKRSHSLELDTGRVTDPENPTGNGDASKYEELGL